MTRLQQTSDHTAWAQVGVGIVVWLLMLAFASAEQRAPGTDQGAGPQPDVARATFTRDVEPAPVAPEPPRAQIAPAPRPSTAPLTLAAPQPLAAKPSPPARGPLPDWKLLLAVTAAFGILVAFRGVTAYRTSQTAPLPPDVFDVLGSASLGGGQSVRVVRFGPKTLLVSTSTAGCQTLAELTDPQATDRIVAACTASIHPPRSTLRPRLRGNRPATDGRASA